MNTMTQIDMTQLTREDLLTLQRHLRAMLILVDQMLRFPLTSDRRPARD